LATIPDLDLLLDTHAFIWRAGVDKRLAETARAAIADAENRVVVSAVTVWEISVKRAIGKLEFRHDTLRVLDQTVFEPLDFTTRHADLAGSLPLHHADPFDRLLISQASLEGLVLVSQDRKFLPYGVPLLGII
jgi:PIN domain nuclease of toxin-antitoxin system